VIDGNYSAVLRLVWERADTVVWLDLPRRNVMRRIIWRTIRRAVNRVELWNDNRERWRNLLTWDERESVIAWAWRHYPVYKERYNAAARDPAYAHLAFTRVVTRADVCQLLESARSPCRADKGPPPRVRHTRLAHARVSPRWHLGPDWHAHLHVEKPPRRAQIGDSLVNWANDEAFGRHQLWWPAGARGCSPA
jgi:hypothetical protein